MLLYIAETGMQLHLAAGYSTSDTILFSLYTSYVIASLVIVNIVSAFLVLRTMDFSGKPCGRVVCIILHTLQLGLVWRCFKLFMLYDQNDWKEFLILRLLHTGLQSLPFIITCGYTVIQSGTFLSSASATLFIIFVSSAIAFSSYNIGQFIFEADEYEEPNRKVRRPLGLCFLMLGTFLMLISRCGSIILMLSILTYWVAVPLFVHFIVYFLVTSIYSCYKTKSCSITKILRNILLAYLNTFDSVDPGLTKIHCKNVLSYTAILLENIGMVAPWLIIGNGEYMYKLCVVLVVILGFIFGIVFKTSSCGCIHETVDDNGSIDTVDIAEFIAKKEEERDRMAELRLQSIHKKRKRHKNVDTSENAVETSNNLQEDNQQGCDNEAYLASTQKLQGSTPKRKKQKAKDIEAMSFENAQGGNTLGSSGEVDSSNSRNTNTLNISGQSNHNQNTKRDNNADPENAKPTTGGFLRMARSLKSKNTPKKVRNGSQSGESTCLTPGASPSPSKKSKSKSPSIPLFPNELPTDVIGSKVLGTPKAHHVLSNSVDEYNPDESSTDSTYSEYASYSYYYDTDWSSMFSDESASNWPPSTKVYFSNLHSLPKTKVSTTETVQMWLTRMEEWDNLQEWSDQPEDPPVDLKPKETKRQVLEVADHPRHIRMCAELNSSTSCTDNTSQYESWTHSSSAQQNRYIPNDIPPRERYYSSSTSANDNTFENIPIRKLPRSSLQRQILPVKEKELDSRNSTEISASENESKAGNHHANIHSKRITNENTYQDYDIPFRKAEDTSAHAIKLVHGDNMSDLDMVQESMV